MKLLEGPADPSPSYEEEHSFMEQVFQSIDRNYHLRVEADIRLMEDVAAVDRHQFFFAQGFESTEDWFSARFNFGYRKACEYVRLAVTVQELPRLKQAYREGSLSFDHLRALVRIIDEQNQHRLIEAAKGLSVSKTFAMVKDLEKLDSVDSLIARSQMWLEMSWDQDRRMLMFSGELPEDLGAKFERAIDRAAKKITDDPSPAEKTPMGAKRAQALADLVTSSGASRSSKPLVVVRVDEDTLLDKQDGVAYLQGGCNIAPETARRLTCDSVVRMITTSKEKKPQALGSAKHTIPERLATEIVSRDQGRCVIPWCRNRVSIELHHRDQGNTEYDEIDSLCSKHHHMVHEGGWILKGKPPKVWLEHSGFSPPLVMKVGPPPRTQEIQKQVELELAETSDENPRASPG